MAKNEEAEVEKKTDEKAEKPALEGKMAEFVDWIEGISVRELSVLVKALEERLGVTAAAPVVAAAAAQAGEAAAPAAEEQTAFTVVLTAMGSQKIAVIKEVRSILGLGLKESKELVESAPKPLKEDITKEEAEEIVGKLEAAGATVELK